MKYYWNTNIMDMSLPVNEYSVRPDSVLVEIAIAISQ